MDSKKLTASIVLALVLIAGIVSAVTTVIPDSAASKISHLGYKSHCTFAPYSTVISVAIALVAFLVAKRFVWR